MAPGAAGQLSGLAGALPRFAGTPANGPQRGPEGSGQKCTLTRKLMVFWSVVKASLSLMPYLFFQ